MSAAACSFRALLRAQRAAFNGDAVRIAHAAKHTRDLFLKHKDETDPSKISELLNVANQAQSIIRRNIIQGVQRTDSPGVYSLKFRPEIEINSNDSIKKAGLRSSKNQSSATGCCSSSA